MDNVLLECLKMDVDDVVGYKMSKKFIVTSNITDVENFIEIDVNAADQGEDILKFRS